MEMATSDLTSKNNKESAIRATDKENLRLLGKFEVIAKNQTGYLQAQLHTRMH